MSSSGNSGIGGSQLNFSQTYTDTAPTAPNTEFDLSNVPQIRLLNILSDFSFFDPLNSTPAPFSASITPSPFTAIRDPEGIESPLVTPISESTSSKRSRNLSEYDQTSTESLSVKKTKFTPANPFADLPLFQSFINNERYTFGLEQSISESIESDQLDMASDLFCRSVSTEPLESSILDVPNNLNSMPIISNASTEPAVERTQNKTCESYNQRIKSACERIKKRNQLRSEILSILIEMIDNGVELENSVGIPRVCRHHYTILKLLFKQNGAELRSFFEFLQISINCKNDSFTNDQLLKFIENLKKNNPEKELSYTEIQSVSPVLRGILTNDELEEAFWALHDKLNAL